MPLEEKKNPQLGRKKRLWNQEKKKKVSWLACSWAQNSASNPTHVSWLWSSRNVKGNNIKKKKRTYVSIRYDILSICGIFSNKFKTNYFNNHSLEQLTFWSDNISRKTRGSHWTQKSSTKHTTRQPLLFYWW